jgi:hypothetical protein
VTQRQTQTHKHRHTDTQTQRRPACANKKTRLVKGADFDSEGVLDTESEALLVSLGCAQIFANAAQRRGALILHHKCYAVSTSVHLVYGLGLRV